MNMLCYCIHCGMVVYSKKLCPLCEQSLTKMQKHSLLINYLVLKPFINEYLLTIKDTTNEFIIIRGGDVEIFKRQVLTLQMWNQMVDHLISGYQDVGVALTDVFNKKDVYNKSLLAFDKELDEYVMAIVKEKFPDFHIEFDSEKDYVSITEMKKYIWRKIAQKHDEPQDEIKIINDQNNLKKWVVIADVMKVFNIIRIYSGRMIDEKKVMEVINLLRPPTEEPKTKGEKLLNKIETEFWNYQLELSEIFNRLKTMLGNIYNEILSTKIMKGECELCKLYKETANPKNQQSNK